MLRAGTNRNNCFMAFVGKNRQQFVKILNEVYHVYQKLKELQFSGSRRTVVYWASNPGQNEKLKNGT